MGRWNSECRSVVPKDQKVAFADLVDSLAAFAAMGTVDTEVGKASAIVDSLVSHEGTVGIVADIAVGTEGTVDIEDKNYRLDSRVPMDNSESYSDWSWDNSSTTILG